MLSFDSTSFRSGNNYALSLSKGSHKPGESGQVLLIVIMLLATVLTVVISLSFKSTTETQIAKLEEESQKALAAAEAGIEQLLANNNGTAVNIGTLNGLTGSGITGTATTANISDTKFVSPTVQKDQQFTFYMMNYSPGSGFSGNVYGGASPGTVKLYYGSSSTVSTALCNNISLLITFISGSGSSYKMMRYVSDNSSGNVVSVGGGTNVWSSATPATLNNVNFNCQTSSITLPATNTRLMVVRVLTTSSSYSTKIGLQGLSGNLFLQGNTVDSTASTPVGVTKKVELFQSYPQIPTDFFSTGF